MLNMTVTVIGKTRSSLVRPILQYFTLIPFKTSLVGTSGKRSFRSEASSRLLQIGIGQRQDLDMSIPAGRQGVGISAELPHAPKMHPKTRTCDHPVHSELDEMFLNEKNQL